MYLFNYQRCERPSLPKRVHRTLDRTFFLIDQCNENDSNFKIREAIFVVIKTNDTRQSNFDNITKHFRIETNAIK